MSKFLFKNLNHLVTLKARASVSLASHTHGLFYLFLKTHHFSSSSSSSSSVESIGNSSNRSSVTVNYLINSCGLTPERANLVSKRVNLKETDKADSVLIFFKDHGFTETQISKLINCYPVVLASNPQKTLLPKLDFFKSKGFSDSDVAVIISKWPEITHRSLERQLIPSFDFFSELLLSNERKNIIAFKRCAGVLLFDLEKGADNIEILKKAGVPSRNIVYLLANQPRVFRKNCDNFRQIVEKVTKMGFNPLNICFIIAVLALRSMVKSTWDRKFEIYKKWGWSEDDVFVAFKKRPWCMTFSEDKINLVMDFWVNEMGWESLIVAKRPAILGYSFEKRIAPRCIIYKFLVSNGLLNPAEISSATMLDFSEDRFLERFVEPYKKKAPGLLKLYKQKLDLAK